MEIFGEWFAGSKRFSKKFTKFEKLLLTDREKLAIINKSSERLRV